LTRSEAFDWASTIAVVIGILYCTNPAHRPKFHVVFFISLGLLLAFGICFKGWRDYRQGGDVE
jgi:hypothetical protein